jgi:translation initiation factor IF-2
MAVHTIKKDIKLRPPIVVVVGHVDHGKTTILDFIRKTSVVASEAGGITQSIGAYEVEHNGKKITFIDTPGHEAFCAMRAHGAKIADIAILVIAANEGIKAQTTEAINVLKKTQTPFVIAITKIDIPSADVEKVKNELLSSGILLEGSGGDISWQIVSGKTGEGIDELLGLVILTGEVIGLSYDPKARATGFILETKKDSRRGIIVSGILKDGTLKQGDEIVTQTVAGKIKILENFRGERAKELIPSAPVVMCGFEEPPRTGEQFWAGDVNIEVVGLMGDNKDHQLPSDKKIEELEEAEKGTLKKGIKAVLKADTHGSLEALKQVLGDKVVATESSVGEVSDNDIKYARSTNSIIVGFKVGVNKTEQRLAEAQDVKIITSDIIYKLFEAIETLEKTEKSEFKGGTVNILAIFNVGASKQTVGGKIVEGAVRTGDMMSIERNGEVIGRGKVKSLHENKEKVKEVIAEKEAGLVLETDIKIGKSDLLKVILQ